jgi:hypothetical protein
MNTKVSSQMPSNIPRLMASSLARIAAVAMAALVTTSAHAAFHLWNIQQIYTDSSGSLQYVQLFCPFGGQNFINGFTLSVVNVGATQTHSFTVPGGSLGGDTFNHSLLFGTAGLQAAGGPAPDYIIPNNFLFSAGGSINFWGANGGAYTALPTDGSNARNWADGNALNSPQNYAGQTGTVVVPEPAMWPLFGLSGTGFLFLLRRRK